jgi:hypothetical protein
VPSGGERASVTGKGTQRPVAESKRQLVELVRQGNSVKASLAVIGRSVKSYEVWRRDDQEFRALIDGVRGLRDSEARSAAGVGTDIPFAEWSDTFLGAQVFPHQQNVIDMVEGRTPDWLHPAMTFESGERDLCIVNMPPEHAKSTTVTMNYVSYRIAMNPGIRVMVVSKTQAMARKFLYGIKTRLTSERFMKMHQAYAPGGSFKADSASWTQDLIYVGNTGSDEKDPTVQALGVRGHIYGARCDLVILDDVIDGTNAHEFEKQIDWIQSEVVSRISHQGSLLVVGTRLASKDLYLELRNPLRYPDEVSPWSYLAMPAVLEFDDEPAEWVTLWPRSNQPEIGVKGPDAEPDKDGLFPKWPGSRLNKKRSRMTPRTWSMVYMQSQVSDDAVFDPSAVSGVVNGARLSGTMPKDMAAVRNGRGMDGLLFIAGLDPATSGHTAAVCIGLDVASGKRHVVDVYNKAGTRPDEIRQLIMDWTAKYNVSEWRIEKNGFQGFLVHDREVNDFCAARGTLIQAHFTGNNKHDAEFGVASMTMLFNGWEDRNAQIELPSTVNSEPVKALIEQLTTWSPDAHKKQKTDCVMALWFAELGCRDRVTAVSRFSKSHQANPFLTPWDKAQQYTVNVMDLQTQGVFTARER